MKFIKTLLAITFISFVATQALAAEKDDMYSAAVDYQQKQQRLKSYGDAVAISKEFLFKRHISIIDVVKKPGFDGVVVKYVLRSPNTTICESYMTYTEQSGWLVSKQLCPIN